MASLARQLAEHGECRLYRPGDVTAEQDLIRALQAQPLIVIRAHAMAMCRGVEADLDPDPGGTPLRFLAADAREQVRQLSELVRFLPKVGWTQTQTEMLLDGFDSGQWRGLGVYSTDHRQLISYLDYKLRPERDEVEVGFCMTHPDWRGHGLIKRLLGSLILLHFDRQFRISTHDRNQPMARALQQLGFILAERRLADRVNGETTLYLMRAAWTPFDLVR